MKGEGSQMPNVELLLPQNVFMPKIDMVAIKQATCAFLDKYKQFKENQKMNERK